MRPMMIAVGFDTDVVLVRKDDGTYEIEYGKHLHTARSFEEALNEFGNCVRHSAECAGMLDDE